MLAPSGPPAMNGSTRSWWRPVTVVVGLATCVVSLAALAGATTALERLAFATLAAVVGLVTIVVSILQPTTAPDRIRPLLQPAER
jgi:hypothetical protein